MNDNRNAVQSLCGGRDTVYIDTNRILDSCRDKDCFEHVPVYLLEPSCEIFEAGTGIRTKDARIIAATINVDAVPFNRGFYQVNMRIFILLKFEICANVGRAQEIEGICYVDKKVILYGSEGNVNIFKSKPEIEDFCSLPNIELASTNLPTAVLETVDPVILGTDVVCSDRCNLFEFPCSISNLCGDKFLAGRNNRMLTVSIGLFSIVRIERPAQYLVNGTEYTVPEKECAPVCPDDPCSMFRQMAFPVGQFYPPALNELRKENDGGSIGGNNIGGCGCAGKRN